MSMPRAIIFIDGENLLFRFQHMLSTGRTMKSGVVHDAESFLWAPTLTQWTCMDVYRVYYYMALVGDDQRIELLRHRIAATDYSFSYSSDESSPQGYGGIVPIIFKKSSKSMKSRQVDINIAVDMMRFAHNPTIDQLVLYSGDGDFIPLLEEVMRHGKQVYVGALSSGLAPALNYTCDAFRDLDADFF